MSSVRTVTAIVCGAGMVSGKEIMALELGKGMRAYGKQIVYATSSWSDNEYSKRLSSFEFSFYRMRLGFISAALTLDSIKMTVEQIIYWPILLYQYYTFLRKEKPINVIHTNWHHLIMLWPFINAERDVFWLHEVIPIKKRYSILFSMLSRRIGFFVVVSEAVAESLVKIGVRADQIQVIHNGILDPASASIAARTSTGYDIGIVGQIGFWKGHEELLLAFYQISAIHPKSKLHIFGNDRGEFAEHLKRTAHMLNISPRIIWHGFMEKLTDIYLRIDICAVPSRSEDPLPTSAIEAAFYGVPVIATSKGGLPEIVVDGVTGYLVEANEPCGIAKRLDELLRQPILRVKMGNAARERAVQRFNRDRFIKDFIRMLSHVRLGMHENVE